MMPFLVRVAVLFGVLAAVAVRATSFQEASVLPSGPPGTPPAPAETSSTQPAELEISVLRAGPGPYVWAVPGRIAGTFVTDDPKTLCVVAMARLRTPRSAPEQRDLRALEAQIEWEVFPPDGFTVSGPVRPRGSRLDLTLKRAGGNPTGLGDPLVLTVRASVSDGKQRLRRLATLRQDLRDRLRQEYIDLERAYVPERADLLSEDQFEQRFGKQFPSITFQALNATRQPGKEDRYPFILVRPELVRTLHQVQKVYGQALIISSGYRNPVRQTVVHGSVEESFHQYGRAADLYVVPDSAPPRTGRKIAIERDWLRLAAAAIRGGGVWIEPMLACNVNTDGCHVHVDVREAGSRSQVVQVKGRVTDPRGNPVPNAQVRLAGMPAVANHNGEFQLKHVLTPGTYEIEAVEEGRGAVTRPVQVAGNLTEVALELPVDPRPSFIVRGVSGWVDDETGKVARISARLKNVGASAARNLRVSSMLSGKAPMVGPELRRDVVSIPQLMPGAEVEVALNVPLPSGMKVGDAETLTLPMTLIATSGGPAGQMRTQRLALTASLAPEAPDAPVQPASSSDGVRTGNVADLRQPASGRDAAGAAGGLILGGAAAAASARAARKAKQRTTPAETEPEASVLPSNPSDAETK